MITVEHLTKTFKLYQSPADRLKEIISGRKYHKDFIALNDISFDVRAGETLGIIGQNGAGKSTLLKLLMGILLPDTGAIGIDGKITGLLELTTGFNPEFTGLENIYFNGTLRGMTKQEIDSKVDDIIEFSELKDFIHEPVKTYSDGMVMRLAFSTAIFADPQAFVVDEALSVGDAYFQQKCTKKIMEFKEKGGSIIFVSHDLNSVKLLSDKALLLDHGQIVDEGEPDKVISTYNYLLAKKTEGVELRLASESGQLKSYGNFKSEIFAVKMLNKIGQDCEVFISGEKCVIQLFLKAQEDISEITAGILIQDRFGQDIFGTNTHHLELPLSLKRGETCVVEYAIDELNIGPGKYTLSTALHTLDTHIHECYHWADYIKTFEVLGSKDFMFIGLSKLKPAVSIKRTT
jgi:lipopolysaccharide transport system ATP-binding protein